MFHPIPSRILEQMRRLEAIDARDRVDGTPHLERLRQIPPETGRLLAILAASAPGGTYLEIGTIAGYSALYMALACSEGGARLIKFEILAEKSRMAEETFGLAGVDDVVELVHGDAREHKDRLEDIAFCFLDAEKDSYRDFYDLMIPVMVKGSLFVADNVISHADILQPFVDHALADERVDTVVVPIGRGELVCRRR
ncbi:MAG: O-methyltransferase [Candidatus Zixiibacteriota bacterium]|nr:MAG: O-methyltransferase [candidate division Zixibacteria bacterium]